jgi:3-dehydroquinate synthase II
MGRKMVWIRSDIPEDPDERKGIVTASLESDFLQIAVREGDLPRFERLGRFEPIIFGDDGIIIGDRKGVRILIKDKADENRAAQLPGKVDLVVVKVENWKIIPLENLIAAFQGRGSQLLAEVSDISDVKLLFETLEVGVDGIVFVPANPRDIGKVRELIEGSESGKVNLVQAEVTEIKPLGMGDRVCIDTCSMLRIGEGMLIGSQSNGLFLVHSESVDSEYAEPRPFRVNAGPVQSYVLVPNDKTRYLSDLRVGEAILAVDKDGSARQVIIGRVKIEKRPLILLEAKHGERTYSIILQNAETIRLVSGGEPVSIVDLKVGDRIAMAESEGGRHFGMKVKESIIER